MAYDGLSDEDKVRIAIRFVAEGAILPVPLANFLKQENIYDLIVYPKEMTHEYREGDVR